MASGIKLVSSAGGSAKIVAPTTDQNYTYALPNASGTMVLVDQNLNLYLSNINTTRITANTINANTYRANIITANTLNVNNLNITGSGNISAALGFTGNSSFYAPVKLYSNAIVQNIYTDGFYGQYFSTPVPAVGQGYQFKLQSMDSSYGSWPIFVLDWTIFSSGAPAGVSGSQYVNRTFTITTDRTYEYTRGNYRLFDLGYDPGQYYSTIGDYNTGQLSLRAATESSQFIYNPHTINIYQYYGINKSMSWPFAYANGPDRAQYGVTVGTNIVWGNTGSGWANVDITSMCMIPYGNYPFYGPAAWSSFGYLSQTYGMIKVDVLGFYQANTMNGTAIKGNAGPEKRLHKMMQAGFYANANSVWTMTIGGGTTLPMINSLGSQYNYDPNSGQLTPMIYFNLDGSQVIGTVYNSDVTNFPAGTATTGKVFLTANANGRILLACNVGPTNGAGIFQSGNSVTGFTYRIETLYGSTMLYTYQ